MPKPKSKTEVKINKHDHLRVLVTETSPYEVPIIFSNDGFYLNCKQTHAGHQLYQNIFHTIVTWEKGGNGKTQPMIPYSYKIRKNELSVRTLSILHPFAQWSMAKFYQQYENLICHYTSRSPASLRSPYKSAGMFYIRNKNENHNRYKKGEVTTLSNDLLTKHCSSFFVYRGYDRIHKFYDSGEFVQLEATFNNLWLLDVSKCFDSIYTHSISWACKNKKFIKDNLHIHSFFGDEFDSLMQRCNYNETNGIVIGPEVSRVFAEIIFQEIDRQTISNLSKKHELEYGEDYKIKRYVDDIFIFSASEKISKLVYETYSDALNLYKLHVNTEKLEKLQRPFLTKKSKIVFAMNKVFNDFFDKFSKKHETEESSKIIPNKIFHPRNLTISFIDSIKSICAQNEEGYDQVSSYIISALLKRIDKIIYIDKEIIDNDLRINYKNALGVIIDLAFFFYGIAPSVSASYKLGKIIIFISRFCEKHLSEYEHTIKQGIFYHSCKLLSGTNLTAHSDREHYIPLEKINVILPISEIGNDYLLPENIITELFFPENRNNELSYHDIMSCLFYIKNNIQYKTIKDRMIKEIEDRLIEIQAIRTDAEIACLFLDSLSCPYIDESKKHAWLKSFSTTFGFSSGSATILKNTVDHFIKNHWFINWSEIDMLNMLERKELMSPYS